MIVSYDRFIEAFLAKVTEFDFLRLDEGDRVALVDGYMKRTCAQFNGICVYDIGGFNDETREFNFEGASENDVEEITDIVSDGMIVQWLRQHFYKQENLSITLNTTDFMHYSPAELTYRVMTAYKTARLNFQNAMREYSFRHGDLTGLHL